MADEDSDDSEGEGGMGNLNRLIIRPPGHSGKAKRGHLCFDASFETGNLGKVELISEFEYDLFIRPDTCNPRARQWFNFSVDNARADQRVIFNIVNISKRKNLFELGMTPIIKSTSRPKWQRIPRQYIYYYKSPQHNGHNVLSICHGFDKEEDNYQFAFSFPFSYSRCQAHIKHMEQKQYPFFRRELLANSISRCVVVLYVQDGPFILHLWNNLETIAGKKIFLISISKGGNETDILLAEYSRGPGQKDCPVYSASVVPREFSPECGMVRKRNDLLEQKRRVDIITIANSANLETSKKRIIFVIGRINPGDSPTSFVCQGILDFLVSNHPIALRLRDVAIFKIVPMMNPDGVFLGNHRSNFMGFDLNRNWNQLNEWGHPSLYAFDQMVSDIETNKSENVDFILDLHANTSLPGAFVYGNTYDDVYRYERHIVFPKLLAQNAEDYAAENTMYNRDPVKAGTTRRYFYSKLKESTNCYAIEVSFFGYKKSDGFSYSLYTEESYQRLGRNLIRTFLDYYLATGVIQGGIAQTIQPIKNKPRKPQGASSPSKGLPK